MIPEEEIEKVAAANDIVDVIGSHFPLRRAGTVFKALCPFHREKTPSFTVNPSRQTFKCFGCDAGGTVFKFVELYENVNFPEAFRRLAARAGIRVSQEPMTEEEDARRRARRRLLSLHAEVTEWFHLNLLRTKAAAHAREYLKGRGLSAETARSWKLGYAPDSWDALSSFARKNGYSDAELIASGLVTSREGEAHYYDRFRDRLMFPIRNEQGETIAFSGRVLKAEAFGGKYVNSPETPLFTKGKVLFGIDKTKRPMISSRAAIVCEGQIDLITAYEAGFQNVIASQGTAFTEEQARLLKRLDLTEVIVCFDADAAGLKAAERLLPVLLDLGISVRVAGIPAGHDPDSFIRAEGAEAFSRLVAAAPDYFEYQIDRFTRSPEAATPQGKAAFARKMAGAIAFIGDAVLCSAVISSVANRLELPSGQIDGLVRRARKRPSGPRPAEEPQGPTPPEAAFALNPTVRLLCQLILLSPEARAWLMTQAWEPLLSRLVDGALPSRLLKEPFSPGESASLSALLARLEPGEQSALAGLLDVRQLPADPARVAAECWCALQRQRLEEERAALTARLRNPALPPEEVIKLQKQVLDLTQQLTHITRPLPSDRFTSGG